MRLVGVHFWAKTTLAIFQFSDLLQDTVDPNSPIHQLMLVSDSETLLLTSASEFCCKLLLLTSTTKLTFSISLKKGVWIDTIFHLCYL
jgi:hypothetical protein